MPIDHEANRAVERMTQAMRANFVQQSDVEAHGALSEFRVEVEAARDIR
jgi:hypothetical protein